MTFLKNRRMVISTSLAVLLITGLSVLVGFSTSTTTGASSVATCGRGIPIEKCTQVPDPPSSNPVVTITTTPPVWPSPPQTYCGAGFFNSSDTADIANSFGEAQCFTFDNGSTWVVVGSGVTTAGAGAPGGGIVAVETCSTSTCEDATATHSFGDFTVYYPPAASSQPLQMEATFGGRVLQITDGSCGLYFFDISTATWYQASRSNLNTLSSGSNPPEAVSVPPSQSGEVALSSTAPATTSGCESTPGSEG